MIVSEKLNFCQFNHGSNDSMGARHKKAWEEIPKKKCIDYVKEDMNKYRLQ